MPQTFPAVQVTDSSLYPDSGFYTVEWPSDQGEHRNIIHLQMSFQRGTAVAQVEIAELLPTFREMADHFKNRAIHIDNQCQFAQGFDIPQHLL